MDYDYEVIYRAGHENKAADALSYPHESGTLYAISLPKSTLLDDIHNLWIWWDATLDQEMHSTTKLNFEIMQYMIPCSFTRFD